MAQVFPLASQKCKGWRVRHGKRRCWASKAFALEAVSREGLALQYASEELQANHEVVLAAVFLVAH